MKDDRIIVMMDETEEYWSLIGNPAVDCLSKCCNEMLHNGANEYVEYKNCGVRYRMIRKEAALDYGISGVSQKSTLTQKMFEAKQ